MKDNKHKLLVITDLNGTLLDRDSGSPAGALPALDKLQALNIPVIFNSSKPAQEIIALRAELNNTAPFISENGAALHLPTSSLGQKINVQLFGKTRNNILHYLAEIADEQEFSYLSFSTMSTEQVIELTGLPSSTLHLMLARRYTEPLLWQDSLDNFNNFRNKLSAFGLHVRREGDVVQVMAPVNKATPLNTLLEWYKAKYQFENPKVLALGDGPLDIPMFVQADIAVFIKSGIKPVPEFSHDRLIVSELEGSLGWNECMLDLIAKEAL